MNHTPEVMSEAFGKQRWDAPAWFGNLWIENNAMIFKTKMTVPKTIPLEPLHIFEYPHPGGNYTIALDPSAGTPHGDDAAIQIVGHGGIQVAEMLMEESEQRYPDEQLRIAIWLAEFYNNASLVVEVNGGVGAFLLERLERIGYKHIWRNRYDGQLGWLTTKKSRGEAIRFLQEGIHSGYPFMRSLRMREQLEAFTGDGPAKDDLVSAFLIAFYCSHNHRWEVE